MISKHRAVARRWICSTHCGDRLQKSGSVGVVLRRGTFCWTLARTPHAADGSPTGEASVCGCRPLAPAVRVARSAFWAVAFFATGSRTQVGAQAQHRAPEARDASSVVAAARGTLADHHAVMLDAARSRLTTVRALAHTAEALGICGSPTVAQTDCHDRNHKRAQRNPTRHAYCLAAR